MLKRCVLYTRLKKNSDFQKLFARGKKAFSPALIVLYLPAKETRMGLCVSKKHGKSVRRNRIKRLLREAFRAVCGGLQGNYIFVLIPKQAETYSLDKFKKCLYSALKREGLI